MPALLIKQVILVVEDDAAIGDLLHDFLNAEPPYHAIVVSAAEAALELIPHVHIDLFLLDVNLPGMDGLQLYARLQQDPQTAQTPVLFMTASAHDPRLVAVYPAPILAKPFSLTSLLALVTTVLG